MTRFLAMSAFLIASVSAVAFAQEEPTSTAATFSKIYVPIGFDNNDHVQIVGEGVFENACYRPAPTTVKIDADAKTITLGPVAYKYSGFCLQVVLPFERVIDIGILKPGIWKVTQGTDPKVIAEIPVTRTNSFAPDDHLYAPISQAFLRQSGSRTTVFVTGQFSSSCLSIEKLDIDVSAEAVIVLPIVAMDKTECKAGVFPFSKSVAVSGLKAGRFLMHVRSLNGNAINQLVNVQ